MGNNLTSDMHNIFLKRHAKRMRCSSYDRTGGNDDSFFIEPGATCEFANIEGPAIISHFFCTMGNQNRKDPVGGIGHEEFNVRKVVLRVYWDDETEPSIQAPIGDFFGMGHGVVKSFSSAPLQMSPLDGHGFNCWFPMPFRKRARFTVTNECKSTLNLYFFLDYELVDTLPEDTLYFHAQWNRECPTVGVDPRERSTHTGWIFGEEQDRNVTGDGNYVILEAEGSGHYVGCNINILNLEPSRTWDWFGEGDDMIFIDGEPWPPRLHGTGLEDYIGLAWCPTQEYNSLYHGCILAPTEEFKGKTTYYRYHVKDPIIFEKSIKVTVEHGHGNLRSDDYSTTAYWYQSEPHRPMPEILPVEQRMPVNEKVLWWTGRVELHKNEENVK